MRPISVESPVLTTTAWALPRVTYVPMNTMLSCSARLKFWSERGADCLYTACDSPVKLSSLTSRVLQLSKRQSAGTMLPASSRMISPGTSSPAGIRIGLPPRITMASGAVIRFNPASDFSARFSWIIPIRASTATITRMLTASVSCRSSNETAPAPNSR